MSLRPAAISSPKKPRLMAVLGPGRLRLQTGARSLSAACSALDKLYQRLGTGRAEGQSGVP